MQSSTGQKQNPSKRRMPKQKANMRSPDNRSNHRNKKGDFSGGGGGGGLDREFLDFKEFLKDRTAGGGRKGGPGAPTAEFRNRVAAARVKDLLEHQLAMLKLTKQMNKLLGELSGGCYSNNASRTHSHSHHNSHHQHHHPQPGNKYESSNMPNSNTTQPTAAPRKSKKSSSEYVIFSGGPKGLEYSSLKKSRTGTFRMEIDVSEYEPEHIAIHTDNKKTMHVKACRSKSGVRKTLKIVSPDGIDIDDVIIHYPEGGILLLEAP